MLTTKVGDKGTDVYMLQRALNSLAYVLKEDGVFGPQTARAVMQFQKANGLAVNGDANAETIAALERKVPAEMPAPASANALEIAGRRALEEAIREWQLDVYDPRASDVTPRGQACKDIITGIIRRAGWGWSIPESGYVGDGPPQWCGLFALDCWLKAGLVLDVQIAAIFWASTLRMAKWFRYGDWNGNDAGTAPQTGARMIINPAITPTFPDGTSPRAGDVVIVGDGKPDEGDHITLLEAVTTTYGRPVFHTVSGNGGGVGPTGKPREGISKQDYRIDRGGYRVLWVGRPGLGDVKVIP